MSIEVYKILKINGTTFKLDYIAKQLRKHVIKTKVILT